MQEQLAKYEAEEYVEVRGPFYIMQGFGYCSSLSVGCSALGCGCAAWPDKLSLQAWHSLAAQHLVPSKKNGLAVCASSWGPGI